MPNGYFPVTTLEMTLIHLKFHLVSDFNITIQKINMTQCITSFCSKSCNHQGKCLDIIVCIAKNTPKKPS